MNPADMDIAGLLLACTAWAVAWTVAAWAAEWGRSTILDAPKRKDWQE